MNNSEPYRLACKSFRFLCEFADLGYVNWVSMARELQEKYNILSSDNISTIESKVRSYFENYIMSNINENLV